MMNIFFEGKIREFAIEVFSLVFLSGIHPSILEGPVFAIMCKTCSPSGGISSNHLVKCSISVYLLD